MLQATHKVCYLLTSRLKIKEYIFKSLLSAEKINYGWTSQVFAPQNICFAFAVR